MNHAQWMASVGRTKVTGGLGLSPILVTILAMQAFSQTIPIDNFNDGWSMIDSTVGRPYGPGVFEVRSGAYHLETAGVVPVGTSGFLISTLDKSSEPVFSDGFLRTKVRADTDGTLVSLALRLSGTLQTGLNTYLFQGASPGNGGPFSPSGFGVVKFERSRATRFIRLEDPNLTFAPNEWYHIEAGAVGNELSMKVWRDGDLEPESPQLMFTDSTLSAGVFGVESDIPPTHGRPAQVSATFDDLAFTFPPAPNPVTLAPYDIYLWESPMPVPQVEGPFFTPGSPEKPDMRGDITTANEWPDLRITGQVTDLDGQPIPGLKLDFWQVDDQGSYDNSGGHDLRGHLFTDEQGNYELWTVMPANYESIRSRHLHAKIGGENKDFDSWAYTTQIYFPEPYDNDIDADGSPDKVIEGGVVTDLDAIALGDDFITAGDLERVGAEFSDLVGNILTVNNDPLADGYFETTLNITMPQVFQAPESPKLIPLQAGDADQDLDFDQLDLVQVQVAAKYLTGHAATWGEGDWNAAPGGSPGNPPPGDGLFNQFDVIAAQQAATYLTGPYAAIQPGGQSGDSQTSLVYNASSGELSVDAPAGQQLTSINVTSAAGRFIGNRPAALDGAFDNFAADNVFKATFGGSFGSISFGNVLPAGIAEGEIAADLSAVGSLAAGGELGNVDLVYVPEPTSMLLLIIAFSVELLFLKRGNRKG